MNKYKDTIELIVRLVIKKDDTVLLCQNKETGNYYLPGGHVEFGDTLEKTIYKEMNEELGWEKENIISFKFKGYLENFYSSKEGSELHAELNMIFDVETKDINIDTQESHIAFKWIRTSDIANVNLLPETTKQFLL